MIFLFILLPILCPIFVFLELIEGIIDTVIGIVNGIIPGDGPIEWEGIPSLDDVDEIILGCGKKHVAPLIREVMQFHTEECGLAFQSSILVNDQRYAHTAMLLAQNEKGRKFNEDVDWIDENRWNVSPLQILDKLAFVHNSDYRIKNGKLIYERKDFFLSDFADATLDLTALCADGTIERFEYLITKGGKAYGKFEFSLDGIDEEGNRLLTLYNDIVDWNDPPKEHLTGDHRVQNEFGAARFMFDKATQEKDNFFDYDRRIDIMRSQNATGFLCPLIVSNPRNRDLILGNNTAFNIKLLALEPNTSREDAKTVRRLRGSSDGLQFYDYNYPYYYDANYPVEELYQNFHFIDDPNLSHGAYYEINGSVTILLTKQLAQDIIEHGTDIEIITHLGSGKGESFVIDRDKKEVTISGIKIPCS